MLEKTTERLRAMRDQFTNLLDESLGELRSLAHSQPQISSVPALSERFAVFREALQDTPDSKGQIIQHCDDLISWFDAEIIAFNEAANAWQPALEKHQAEYEEQKKALQGKQSVLDAIESLNVQLRTTISQLGAATLEESALRDADRQLEKFRKERTAWQAELHDLVKKQIETIRDASSGLARGQLAKVPDFAEASQAIRAVLELPMIRESRIENLTNSILDAEDIAAEWNALQNELISLVKWKEGAPAEKGVPPATPILLAALEDNFMEKLRDGISADRVSTAVQAVLRPKVEIFQLRDGAEIEFRKASQGEQAATLLNILMNQSNGPLIIDQPEEDLDNRIINDIIRTIRKTKAERQLILATHNANIAVNGDSENVIEMVLGERKAHGAIDELDVRDAITKTMEGGKEAFELRRKKYNF